MPMDALRCQGHQAFLEQQAGRVADRGERDGRHRDQQRRMQREDQVRRGEQQPQDRSQPLAPPSRDEPASHRIPGQHPEGRAGEQEARWLRGGRLQINACDCPPREIPGAELLFVPVTPGQGWASWAEPHRYALIYPCSGVLAGPDLSPATGPLARLPGPGRAGVLLRLDTPKSTTQLVALTGQRLGSVGRHLRVLLDAWLIERRRAGRSVLYYRTTTEDALVHAQDPAGGA